MFAPRYVHIAVSSFYDFWVLARGGDGAGTFGLIAGSFVLFAFYFTL